MFICMLAISFNRNYVYSVITVYLLRFYQFIEFFFISTFNYRHLFVTVRNLNLKISVKSKTRVTIVLIIFSQNILLTLHLYVMQIYQIITQ